MDYNKKALQKAIEHLDKMNDFEGVTIVINPHYDGSVVLGIPANSFDVIDILEDFNKGRVKRWRQEDEQTKIDKLQSKLARIKDILDMEQ